MKVGLNLRQGNNFRLHKIVDSLEKSKQIATTSPTCKKGIDISKWVDCGKGVFGTMAEADTYLHKERAMGLLNPLQIKTQHRW